MSDKDTISFQVGENFPLPIKNQGDGGLFQVDSNGIMFILQLSHTDIIAIEAFRTGKMELALFEEKGILFLLYQIDGIFKAGWGDAPLALHLLPNDQLPTEKSLKDPAIHLYLVDTTLQVLLAQRTVSLSNQFHKFLIKNVNKALEKNTDPDTFMKNLQAVWQKHTSENMRKNAAAVEKVALSIPTKTSADLAQKLN